MVGPWEALGLQIAPQMGRVVTARRPALLEIGSIRLQAPGIAGTAFALREGVGRPPPAEGPRADPDLSGDMGHGEHLLAERAGLRVLLEPLRPPRRSGPPGAAGRGGGGQSGGGARV